MQLTHSDDTAARRLAGQRFTAQLLADQPAASAVEVAERLLAVQGQDARGARLAVRARTRGLTAADVDRALTTDRLLLITWLNRGTLHLIRTEDYWWLHRLTARPQLQTSVMRMLGQAGVGAVEADKAVADIETSLVSSGPQTRMQLRDTIASTRVRTEGNIPLHLIALASLRGIAVRGPMVGAQHAYVHVRDWLGTPPAEPDHDAALAWLARRYLAGHGPAADRDLAKWAGIPLGQARRGLTEIAHELRDRPDGLAELAAARQDGTGMPAPRLLGSFDPVLLGWASRDPILGEHQAIVTVNGLFRPFVLVDGRAAGTWRHAGGQISVDRFDDYTDEVEAALAAEASDVQRFLGSAQLDESEQNEQA
ncbi:MAG TPA: winged helix DNA-binding domain-containing protein [Streptosporangiaceae bacterium]|nr:winged helix DNA-binding domain-containing protein [Streptosporangiaceae bacterium]